MQKIDLLVKVTVQMLATAITEDGLVVVVVVVVSSVEVIGKDFLSTPTI